MKSPNAFLLGIMIIISIGVLWYVGFRQGYSIGSDVQKETMRELDTVAYRIEPGDDSIYFICTKGSWVQTVWKVTIPPGGVVEPINPKDIIVHDKPPSKNNYK